MIFDWQGILAGVAGTIITGFFAWFTFLKKSRTDEASIALEAWKELVSPMQKQLEEMKQKEEEMRKAIESLKTENQRLLARIKELEEKQA